MNELTEAGTLHCANCGTPLGGEFCHHCGQSVHSVLKPVHHMLEDGMDMFLHVDGRIFHTLPPLLSKPGFLTLEYFSGRRQRYVAPFRLMFVLCLLAFFAFHLAVDVVMNKRVAESGRTGSGQNTFAEARTAQEVQARLAKSQGELEATRKTMPTVALPGIDAAENQLREQANKRLAELGKAPARASSAAARDAGGLDRPVHLTSKMDHQIVHVAWLPQFMNERLDLYVHRMLTNIKEAFGDENPEARQLARERLITGVFAVLPQAMVVMIPIFALLLKLFYVFKRRLYMEHLIVALHSHAFLFLALLLVAVLGMLSTWLRPHAAWTGYVFGYLQGAVFLWMPTYLLLMQKRIYRQGWAMTVIKYWFIGWCYFWLLSSVLGLAVVLGAGH
ncbi:DUF3667 domain-containing protein [Frateuria terrea]|uniref:DUF3667 domain-containing protein n=1 Tax=Frateuria terrea TaxID=529704 RepID=A0A1H6S5K0_9GAMM|nr:DUF3667 domain-containing protein [Frateuria terrea]SEI63418.1 Protein of unknown function [Frateuria terrea]SFP24014.1 Protein of unknown function [Frateuria terrea]